MVLDSVSSYTAVVDSLRQPAFDSLATDVLVMHVLSLQVSLRRASAGDVFETIL
jgi:hypothetical protein